MKHILIPHPSQARKPLHGRHADLVAKATTKPTLRGELKKLAEFIAIASQVLKAEDRYDQGKRDAYVNASREIEILLERKDLQ